jgi:hypothetical protein
MAVDVIASNRAGLGHDLELDRPLLRDTDPTALSINNATE